MHWVWFWTWIQDQSALAVGMLCAGWHWKRFNHSISMQLESKFSLQNGAQDKLIWSSPVPSYSLRAKQPFRTICRKQNVPLLLGLEEKTNHPLTIRINPAAVSTNTNMKEHNLTVCLILGLWVFLSLSVSSELFWNIFSAVSATVDIFKIFFLLCHSATDWKSERIMPAFKGMHTVSASMKSIC